jgi:hypothetical protein
MNATSKIYIYDEHCTMKGRIYTGTDDEAEECGDVSLFGEGTDEELITQALDDLAHRYDLRAGGAGDSFRWRCAREVLRHLGGPAVEYSAESRAWLPVVESAE